MTNLTLDEKKALIRMALEAREQAYVPYSDFMVGAALRAEDGRIFTGCNVENAAFTPTSCAERTALFKAVSEGVTRFTDIAVVGSRRGEVNKQITSPCGVCRQALFEFGGPELNVIMAKTPDDFIERSMDELLPFGFGPSNCYCITFKEEQAGYLAGYAIAKDGKTKLGFLGGMAVPAVIRYGYGFVQGADAAAAELGQNIEINYFYGGQFYGDANITSRMEGWYSNGTQVVFACGGGIYTSAVEAALKNNGYVIGVDVDQNYIGANGVADGTYAYNPFITSAMKGLSEAVSTSLSDIEAGEWSTIAATNGNFGLQDGDYIGLPTDEDSWNFETFTVEEYEELKQKIASGEIVVDNSSDDATKPTVSEFTNVTYIQ